MGTSTGRIFKAERCQNAVRSTETKLSILENGRHGDSYGPMEGFTFISLDGLCLITLCTSTYSIALLMLQLQPAVLASNCNGWPQTTQAEVPRGFLFWIAPKTEL